MKTTRRDFLTGTTAGLAAGLVVPSIGLAGAQRRGGGAGQGEGRGLPAMQPVPASFPGTKCYCSRIQVCVRPNAGMPM